MTCTSGCTWKWGVGGILAGDGDPLNDLVFFDEIILDFVDDFGFPRLVRLPPPPRPSTTRCTGQVGQALKLWSRWSVRQGRPVKHRTSVREKFGRSASEGLMTLMVARNINVYRSQRVARRRRECTRRKGRGGGPRRNLEGGKQEGVGIKGGRRGQWWWSGRGSGVGYGGTGWEGEGGRGGSTSIGAKG